MDKEIISILNDILSILNCIINSEVRIPPEIYSTMEILEDKVYRLGGSVGPSGLSLL